MENITEGVDIINKKQMGNLELKNRNKMKVQQRSSTVDVSWWKKESVNSEDR